MQSKEPKDMEDVEKAGRLDSLMQPSEVLEGRDLLGASGAPPELESALAKTSRHIVPLFAAIALMNYVDRSK